MKNINIFELSLFYNRPKIGLEFGFYAKSKKKKNIYIYIYINKSLYFSWVVFKQLGLFTSLYIKPQTQC